jgi:hypothetical protein
MFGCKVEHVIYKHAHDTAGCGSVTGCLNCMFPSIIRSVGWGCIVHPLRPPEQVASRETDDKEAMLPADHTVRVPKVPGGFISPLSIT